MCDSFIYFVYRKIEAINLDQPHIKDERNKDKSETANQAKIVEVDSDLDRYI